MEAQNAIYLDEETGGKGRQFKARFLVPGLVKYDYGVCLLTKENADKFIQGFIGCPVVINHQTVTDDNAKAVSVGNIFSVWFDEKDGYYWCNGIINDKEAIDLINKGYSVSCQYTITEYSDNEKGALHNGNPYDKVIENGKPEHLAIVNNPRYEGAIIAVNALLAENEDKWITIHPNGEENKGRHLLLKDGESVEDAMHRNGWYEKRQAKETQKKEETKTESKPEQKQSDKEENAEPKKYTYTLTKKEVGNDAWLGGMADTGNYYTNGSFAIDKRYLDIKGQEPKKVPDIDNNVKKLLTETAKKKQKEENYTNVKDFEVGELKSESGKPIPVAKYSYDDEKYGYTRNIYVNKKYNDLFKNFELKFGSEYSPIYAYDKGELVGILMPIQGRDSSYTASNSFVSQFKDTLYTALAEGIANRLGELIASNEDKWITIHPHGEDSDDYRRLLIKDGETVEDAMHRQGYYNKRQAKDERALKEEQKQLYHDILKAKKEGNKELHHKLLQRYNEIDAILKGDKKQGTDTKKEEPKKDNITNVKQSKHFEKFNKLLDQEKELLKEWEEKRKIYDEELEKNKKYQELEKKETEIRKQLMTTDYYKDREKYASLQAEKNKISEEKRKIRDEIEQKTGLFEAQRKWSDASIARSDESKNMIKNSSNDIKQQIAKVSSRNDKLVKAFNTLQKDPYILHKNEERKLKKEYDDLLEKYSKMQWGTDEYKATYQKAKEKNAEYVRAYYKSKKMLADFAPKISKLLQVENGVKFETIAENKAMEENAKRLKEVLNGLIPQDVIDNKPLKIYHTGAIRASQSGQSINLHNDERMGTIIHETAHQLEENNPQMLINSLAFAKSRTEGEKQMALSKLASGYRRDEYCKPDKFFDPYCGKLYTLFGGRDRSFVDGHASEIMSMGLQNVFEDPINFAKEDREYFDFVISNLRGDLWD